MNSRIQILDLSLYRTYILPVELRTSILRNYCISYLFPTFTPASLQHLIEGQKDRFKKIRFWYNSDNLVCITITSRNTRGKIVCQYSLDFCSFKKKPDFSSSKFDILQPNLQNVEQLHREIINWVDMQVLPSLDNLLKNASSKINVASLFDPELYTPTRIADYYYC